jgi:hypothetical protein
MHVRHERRERDRQAFGRHQLPMPWMRAKAGQGDGYASGVRGTGLQEHAFAINNPCLEDHRVGERGRIWLCSVVDTNQRSVALQFFWRLGSIQLKGVAMERREFLKMGTAAGLVSSAKMLEPLAQAEQAGSSAKPIPKRKLGNTGEELSIIGFAGIVVMENSPSFASNIVAEAADRGINYFDVAPTYRNAQERLGPALEPYRTKVF